MTDVYRKKMFASIFIIRPVVLYSYLFYNFLTAVKCDTQFAENTADHWILEEYVTQPNKA